MTTLNTSQEIQNWLNDIRNYVAEKDYEMLPILSVCEEESRFARKFIAVELDQLPKGAYVLEVGAGSLLLSCQLVREGYTVFALEPRSEDFPHLNRLRELILRRAEELGCLPRIIYQRAEEFSRKDFFDFAFSINVMEHVNDVKKVVANIGDSLRHGAKYHFTCPNYLFPYEPHFNIPTILNSKKLTEKVYKKKIQNNKAIFNPIATWRSLNWISVWRLKKITNQFFGLNIRFNRMFLLTILERVAYDQEFAARRSNWTRIALLILLKLRLHHVAKYVPVFIQPSIDCVITKTYIKRVQ